MHGQEERKSGKGRRKRSSNIPFCLAGQLNTIMTAATLCFCPVELKKETCWDGSGEYRIGKTSYGPVAFKNCKVRKRIARSLSYYERGCWPLLFLEGIHGSTNCLGDAVGWSLSSFHPVPNLFFIFSLSLFFLMISTTFNLVSGGGGAFSAGRGKDWLITPQKTSYYLDFIIV